MIDYEFLDELEYSQGDYIPLPILEKAIGFTQSSDYKNFSLQLLAVKEYLSARLTNQIGTDVVIVSRRGGLRILTESESVYHGDAKNDQLYRQALKNQKTLTYRDTSGMDEQTKEVLHSAKMHNAQVVKAMKKARKEYPSLAPLNEVVKPIPKSRKRRVG